MEEDIIIVKELLQGAKDNGMYDNNKYFYSIENLIKGYRELEEKNKKLVEANDNLKATKRIKTYRETEKYFIPKSKVLSIMRDIQERTEKLINTTYVPSSSRIYNDNKERYEPMLVGRTIAMGALKSLQELMEDK